MENVSTILESIGLYVLWVASLVEQKNHVKKNGMSSTCMFQIYASNQTPKVGKGRGFFKNQKERFLATLYPGFRKRLYTSPFLWDQHIYKKSAELSAW